jgi:hypothetical protein
MPQRSQKFRSACLGIALILGVSSNAYASSYAGGIESDSTFLASNYSSQSQQHQKHPQRPRQHPAPSNSKHPNRDAIILNIISAIIWDGVKVCLWVGWRIVFV